MLNQFSALQLDALKEVGNIGTAHAATALSQVVNKKIMISVSKIEVVPVAKLAQTFGGPSTLAAVSRIHVLGDIKGDILLALRKKEAYNFADIIKGQPLGSTSVLDDFDKSALKETGCLLAASYLQAIGDFLKLSVIPSVPVLMIDKMGEILDKVCTELAKRVDVAFCLETQFLELTNSTNGYFILIPDIKSLEIMFKSLGIHE